ncbi:hypothetical protein RIF29_00447 [Crotalaria pallida]|uniref:Uncharacterized protein n=1 Tax=Crotalaria pallida TaxID=3830 RepID=A0AAN9IWN2_CROPI
MASPKYSIKIHEHCRVAPLGASSTHSSLPLSFFDLSWLRFHPVECTYFYPFPFPLENPSSYFFEKVVPRLKTSLSLTLQHFLPLAGNFVWPHDSETPIVKYTTLGDDEGVSLVIAESDADFNHILNNSSSPHDDAIESRSFVPHLESSHSFAHVISLQVTLFQKSGFCIGISTHHAFLDGKSAITFTKAWASMCSSSLESSSPSLDPEFEPFFDRNVIKDPTGLNLYFTNNWSEVAKLFPPEDDDNNNNNATRSLKILPFKPRVEDSIRATFELTRTNLENLKKRVLSKWDTVVIDDEVVFEELLKPQFLSSFVVACAYVSVSIAKAIHGIDKKKEKFAFSFTVDFRARLKPPIPANYFGNCVLGESVDTHPTDYIKEDGFVIVAKKFHNKLKKLDNEVVEDVVKNVVTKFTALASEGVEIIGIVGSNRFGMYGIDFGWGKPVKVDIASVDRSLVFSIIDNKDGNGGIQVGLVLNKHVMDLFSTLFHAGLCIN